MDVFLLIFDDLLVFVFYERRLEMIYAATEILVFLYFSDFYFYFIWFEIMTEIKDIPVRRRLLPVLRPGKNAR